MNKELYVIIPVYNEQAIISNSVNQIVSALLAANIPYQLVLVDDGSTDGTWDIIYKISSEQKNITALRFSRNFGKEGAIFAGLDICKGACAAVMDCDMQHPVEILIKMYELWDKDGFEIVEAVKSSRGEESYFNRISANVFYGILKWLSGISLKNASDFRLLDQKVVEVLRAMPERQTFFRGMSTWVGYKHISIPFDVPLRYGGSSKWSKLNLYRYAMSALTSYSSFPLHAVSAMGIIFLFFGIILAAQTLYMKFSGYALSGFTTVILLLIIVGSILMLGLGIIGMYIAKIYEEIKYRPRYIVKETVSNPDDDDKKGNNDNK